jgi:aspartate racemase
MKTIGLIGGMSWHSTLEYYRIINQTMQVRLGEAHSARCLLYSLDYMDLDRLERENRWDEVRTLLTDAVRHVEQGGADFLVICSNTTHKMAEQINFQIPLLHIADATGLAIRSRGLQRVGLLGTSFTMEEDFIRGRLVRDYGLDVIIPPPADRAFVNQVIYDELCAGQFLDKSRLRYCAIMHDLVKAGAQGIILGCTEIGLLVHAEDSPVPLFDTAEIHAVAAVAAALDGS